ncbi:MAG: Gfo/Idh/MocA family protein [Nanoarchaeota archaeon]
MEKKKIGIVGIGGFGHFLVDAYAQIDTAEVYAVCDRDEKIVTALAESKGIAHVFFEYEKMLALEEVDIIVIATPPFLHGPMAEQALAAGKYVVCEKPLATAVEDADRIRGALEKAGTGLTMNFVVRKNPLSIVLKKIFSAGILGKVQSFTFTNHASNWKLPKEHWFWDQKKSGGIWIEHGVHFFDLMQYLLESAPSSVMASGGKRYMDRDMISAMLQYENGVMGSFTHSFTMPKDTELCRTRFVTDAGYVDLMGWIPERIQIEAVMTRQQQSVLMDHLSGFRITENVSGDSGEVRLLGERIQADTRVSLAVETGKEKPELYQDALRDIMRDFIGLIEDGAGAEIGYAQAREAFDVAMECTKQSHDNI